MILIILLPNLNLEKEMIFPYQIDMKLPQKIYQFNLKKDFSKKF